MKIAFLSPNRNHHFDLLPYLPEYGVTPEIYTAFPRWKLKQEASTKLIHTFPWFMTPKLGLQKMGLAPVWLERTLNWWGQKTFDRYVKHQLKDCDVVEAMSCYGYETGRAVQKRGGQYIVHRGSAHASFQDKLMKEEHARWQVPFVGCDARILKQELLDYEQADWVNVPSEYARQSFITQGFNPDKIVSLPYGVNVAQFNPICEPDKNKFTVLFAGQVSLRKGVPYLLEAFKSLNHPNKELIFAGTVGEDMKSYLNRYSPGERITWLGALPRHQMREVMSRSHVMVLPSIDDGFGKVITEAMACRCPVLCSEHTGGYGYLNEGVDGLVVPIRSSSAIAEKLQELADDPALRHRLAEAAYKKVMEQQGWETYVKQFVEEIRKRKS